MFIHHPSKFGKFSLKIGEIFFFKVEHFLICFHNLHIVQWLPVVPFTCSNGLFTVAACCKITNIVGNPKQEMWKCFWSQIQVTKSNKSKVTNGRWAKLQTGETDYERSEWENASPQIRNVISRNTVSKNEEIQLGDMPPERWRNWRKGVRGSQWPSEIFQIVSKWQNLKLIHDWIQFLWAF